MRWLGCCALVVGGCGPVVSSEASADGTGTAETGSVSTSGAVTSAAAEVSTSPVTSAGPTGPMVTTAVDGSTGSTGVECEGGTSLGDACTPFDDDCPPCFKCMPWANDGGTAWNANNCSPIEPSPDNVGEACTVLEDSVSGIDSCDASSMCWYVEPNETTGECVAFCIGTIDAPDCADPNSHCIVANGGVLSLCLPVCDPLLSPCEPGYHCHAPVLGEPPTCLLSTPERAYGDPCEYQTICDEGLFCALQDDVPGCVDPVGCCSEFCDVNLPDTCQGAGQQCVPWFPAGEAPPAVAHLGGCVIP